MQQLGLRFAVALLGLVLLSASVLWPASDWWRTSPRLSGGRQPHGEFLDLAGWEPLLGRRAFNATTRSPEAQRLFGIGLQLLYNFDQHNARAAFTAALNADPGCASCAWGLSHSFGPFLNHPTKSPRDLSAGGAAALDASRLLASRRAEHSAKEQVLIDSIAVRYNCSYEHQRECYRHYAAVMRSLRKNAATTESDPDLMVFDAEAMMVLMCDDAGYHFYESRGDEQPPVEMPATREASTLLRTALNLTNQSHPYAQHLLIHSTEMSNVEAQKVVGVAHMLFQDMKGLQDQHLQHMTSHTFFRTGHYHDAILSNVAATQSDRAYLSHGLVPYGAGHNCAFLVCSALWGGERATAYKYAAMLQGIYRDAPNRSDGPGPSRAWAYPMVVTLRFGDWNFTQAMDAAPPAGFSEAFPYGFHVLRSFSLAASSARLGRSQEAQAHLEELRAFMPLVVDKEAHEVNLSAIANHTATAVIAGADGDHALAVEAQAAAAAVEMAFPYWEPPDWILPSRECHGQALLNIGRLRDAEVVFRAALYGYSFHAEARCGWALFGLRASLMRQPASEQRRREIEDITRQIQEAWQYADVPLTSACPLLQF